MQVDLPERNLEMVDQLWDENIHRVELYLDKVLKLQRAERRLNGELNGMITTLHRLDPVMAKSLRAEGFNCSFCGKHQDDTKLLIAAKGVFICDECVGLCNEILAERKAEEDSQDHDS